MRNKTKSSDGGREDSWLTALARGLRNWLDHYLTRDTGPVAESARAQSEAQRETAAMPSISGPEQEDSAGGSSLQRESDALQHWLDLVRRAAPELLIPKEEAATGWQWAEEAHGQATEPLEEASLPQPEDIAAPAAPQQASEWPLGRHPQQRRVVPQIEDSTKAAPAASQQPSGLGPSWQQPPTKKNWENDTVTKSEISQRARATQTAAQTELTRDARLSRPAPSPGTGDAAKTTLVKTHNVQTRVVEQTEVASSKFRSLLKAPARAGTDSVRTKAADKKLTTNPDSIPAVGAPQRVASGRNSQNENIWPVPRPVSPVHPEAFHEVRRRASSLEAEQNEANVPLPTRARRANAKSNGEQWPFVDDHMRASTTATKSLQTERVAQSQANMDWWPELPQELPPDNLEGMEAFRGLEHAQALDLEQQGGN